MTARHVCKMVDITTFNDRFHVVKCLFPGCGETKDQKFLREYLAKRKPTLSLKKLQPITWEYDNEPPVDSEGRALWPGYDEEDEDDSSDVDDGEEQEGTGD